MFQTAYTAGGRLDPPHYPTYRVPYIAGVAGDAQAQTTIELEYTVPFDGEMYSISIDCSSYQNDDNWDLYVDDEMICEKIYVKRAPEGINLMAYIPVAPGMKVKVVFRNLGAEKKIWFSMQYLRDGDMSIPPTGLSPIRVSESVVRIYLIDDGDEDGDRIAVYLNGAKLVDDHFLRHEPEGVGTNGTHYIEVPLQRGDNTFIFEGVSPGAVNSYTTAKFKVTKQTGEVIYKIDELPNLRMTNEGVDSNQMYVNPKPRVSWIVNRVD